MRLRVAMSVLLTLCVVAGCAFQNIQRDSGRMTDAVEQGVGAFTSFLDNTWILACVVSAVIVAVALVWLLAKLAHFPEGKKLREHHENLKNK